MSGLAKDFKFINALKMAKRKPPPWLIEGLIPVGAFAVLVGMPGIGKSFLALAIALCVATGKRCLGIKVRVGPVLYVSAEGTGGMPVRIRAWLAHRKWKASVSVEFLTHEVDLGGFADVSELLTAIEELPKAPILIVVDTLARCLPGDESSSKDMGKLVTQVDRIRSKTGAAVLLIHHPGKDGDKERGSSALRGAADTMMFIRGKPATLTLKCDKQKDGEPFEPVPLELHKVDLLDGASSCVMRRRKKDQSFAGSLSAQHKKVLNVLKTIDGGASFSDWKSAAKSEGVAISTFGKARKALVDAGFVIEKNGKYLTVAGSAKAA